MELNEISFLELFKFILEDYLQIYTNITTKLNWKLFTKIIKKLGKEAWVWMSVLIKREVQVLLV